jgi:phage repressor protein C with HTH and peptisase S24 domain
MFPEMLKYFRKRERLSQKELAAKIGVAQNTISMYESGRREPDFETLEAFADFFNVSMSMLLGEDETIKAPAQHLTDLQKKYNALDDHGRELVDLVLGAEYRRCMAPIQEPEKIVYIRHYLSSPAAGVNGQVSGSEYEDIPYPEDAPQGADFCLTVNGDSMEPYIPDGSTVYVKRDAPLNDLDVGIFLVDGATYVKQTVRSYDGSLYLLSANPAREDLNIIVPKDSTSTVVCFGKVLLGQKLPAPIYE